MENPNREKRGLAVIWLIGMSASGKTTIGKVYEKLAYSREKWIFLDGDVFVILSEDLGHSIEDRRKNLTE